MQRTISAIIAAIAVNAAAFAGDNEMNGETFSGGQLELNGGSYSFSHSDWQPSWNFATANSEMTSKGFASTQVDDDSSFSTHFNTLEGSGETYSQSYNGFSGSFEFHQGYAESWATSAFETEEDNCNWCGSF